MLAGENALGKYLSHRPDRNGGGSELLLVIGLARDIKSASLVDDLSESFVYLPLQQQQRSARKREGPLTELACQQGALVQNNTKENEGHAQSDPRRGRTRPFAPMIRRRLRPWPTKTVYAFFADFGLAAYTREGEDRWTIPLGPFKSFYEMAASPIVAGDLLVMVCDQQSGSFVIAVDRKTGRARWKTERTDTTIAWARPMVFRPPAGQEQLIVLGSTRLDSYTLQGPDECKQIRVDLVLVGRALRCRHAVDRDLLTGRCRRLDAAGSRARMPAVGTSHCFIAACLSASVPRVRRSVLASAAVFGRI